MLKIAYGVLTLLVAGAQWHHLLHRSAAEEWRSHDPGTSLAIFQSAHREFVWNVDVLREYAHLAAGADIDAAITALQTAVIWEPADPYLWSRLAVLYLHRHPPLPDRALQAARTATSLAPNTVPVQLEQSLLAARFYDQVPPELRTIWDQSLMTAQREPLALARFAITADLELALCEVLKANGPLAPWCAHAAAHRALCEGDPARLSAARHRTCAAAGYRVAPRP